MKYLFILVFTIFIAVGFSAQAIRQAPGTAPLQPVPVDVMPNYSGNMQSGEGVKPAPESESSYVEEVDEVDDETGGIAETLGIPPTESGNSFPTLLALMVVVVSAVIASSYYWYKTHKVKK